MASPPPPYANVTGISRAVMKDSPQETFANYDGNARAGELVVNLDVDPPTLYIGNSLGNLNEVTGGNGGSYGNSNVAAYLPTYTGNLTAANVVVTGNITPSANITYNLGNNTNRWNNLYLAGNTIILGNAIISANGNSFTVTTPSGGNFVLEGNSNSTLGNIVSVNLNGNSNTVLSGNGTWVAQTGGGGNTDRLVNGNLEVVLNANGSLTVPTLTVNLHNGGNQQAQTLQFGDATQQVIITGPTPNANTAAQRIIIQGQVGNGTGEGGDVYLWGGDADTNGGDIKIYAGDADNVSEGSGGYVNIEGGSGFDGGGYVSMQGGQSSNNQGGLASVIGGFGNTVGGEANIQGGQASIAGGPVNITGGYGGGIGGNINIVGGGSANGLSEYGNINLTAGASSWVFGNDGNLTLPSNNFDVKYANGDPVTLGSAALGNLTVDDITLQGDNNQLNLSAGSDYTANLAYLQLRAGDLASHIHLDTGNNEAYDLIIGNDQKFVQVSSTGNIIMSSYDSNTNQYTWTLDTTGNLILADGNSIIRSVANSSLDPLNPNVSTMILTPDAGYSSQSLVLDPTAPGHIHLRAPGANIDEPLANIFLGGEDSSFEVGYYTGSAPNVFIHSGGNTWTFDNTGNLTVPNNILASNLANPAPNISGFSSIETIDGGNLGGVTFANGNITANNIITWTNIPGSNTAAGSAGQAAYDSGGNLYICVSTNTWAKFTGTTSW